jgi:CubicO group peptidase (beta-lactamase class C family)
MLASMLGRREFASLLLPVVCGRRLRGQQPAGDWVSADPADARLRSAALEQVTAAIIKGDYPNTHAVLIEHDGRLVYERYFRGTDERWGQPLGQRVFEPSSLHDIRSASKSVTSALLGIALGKDFDRAVARPVMSFFPRRKARPDLSGVTLHHVLTMTAGFEWNEMTVPYTDPNNDERQMSSVKDPVSLVLARPLRDKPGAKWYYCGGTTQVLAGAITEITGKAFDAIAKEALFAPLGVTEYEWVGPAKWGPHTPSAASGLRMRARDLARFGSVYLHGGKWQGRQIVPAEWVERSMRRHVASIGDWHGRANWGYGYQWWIGSPGGRDVAAAVGNGNERVFVAAKERIVVTILAGEYNKFEGHSERLFEAIMAARG